ncbi:MAG: N-6 DNA methylase [Rikenellaceae bacterium]
MLSLNLSSHTKVLSTTLVAVRAVCSSRVCALSSHHGDKKNISIYGQEYTNTTYKLAKMNLAIRGISCNLGEKAANTFSDDQHKSLKADFIMANPPFN